MSSRSNPDLKPQELDILELPSYMEASKMRPESPPTYLNLNLYKRDNDNDDNKIEIT